jgi:hypothetical protein
MEPALLLVWCAPQIEAAGSVAAAVACGLLGGFDNGPEYQTDLLAQQLAPLLPLSRGGQISQPGADDSWAALVADVVRDGSVDMEALRREVARFDHEPCRWCRAGRSLACECGMRLCVPCFQAHACGKDEILP